MENKLIVVVGATGKQGQSVIDALMNNGYRIRALVRNPEKVASLFPPGIEIFKGDLSDKTSLRLLLDDAYGLFFVLPYSKESMMYGKVLLELAKESNLEHIVYSSVGGAERYTKVDHYNYKTRVEKFLKSLDIPYTILRPVGYMETFASAKMTKVMTGLLSLYLDANKTFQLISLQDIGRFVEIAFSNPDKYQGTELEIAGDELSLVELIEKINQLNHVQLSPMKFPRFTKYLLPKIMKQMFTFYADDGWKADIGGLKTANAKLLSFDDWLSTIDVDTFNKR
ncbi:hypothetical protein RJ45_12765 [Photobacterium gaetbulicola]|uniref:NmrA-like domain-containing protein n=1 Tax=Photobacterium gaetbulicola TaxID=1295392 RepID=A0A0B9H324_9GAMM|nr:NmrA/HSCARG family protein [Photobacterium gaetbulicola]KHT63272.1 hypothetical protein RJ45_12765 [Photobacterium gaetbulicola]